jgi:hypothetical protein
MSRLKMDMSSLKKEIMPQRGCAPGLPVGWPASRQRAAAWHPQTGQLTGLAAAPQTLRPGRRCPQHGGEQGRPVCLTLPAHHQTGRRGVASADWPADGPGCCAQEAAPGTARPSPVLCRAHERTVDELIATINLIKSHDLMTF